LLKRMRDGDGMALLRGYAGVTHRSEPERNDDKAREAGFD
jgi:hypothetical protein